MLWSWPPSSEGFGEESSSLAAPPLADAGFARARKIPPAAQTRIYMFLSVFGASSQLSDNSTVTNTEWHLFASKLSFHLNSYRGKYYFYKVSVRNFLRSVSNVRNAKRGGEFCANSGKTKQIYTWGNNDMNNKS